MQMRIKIDVNLIVQLQTPAADLKMNNYTKVMLTHRNVRNAKWYKIGFSF